MTEQPRRAGGAGLVLLLAGVTALGPLTINLYLPAFPLLTDELGVAAGQVQLSMTGALVGLAVGQLLIGSLSDAFGRRAPLLFGFALYILVSLGIAIGSDLQLLVALRFLQGLFAAAGMVVAMAVVRDLYEGIAVGRAIARLMLVVGVAPVVAPALGSQLLLVGSWRLLFVTLAVLAAILLVLVLLTLPESLPPARRRRGGTRGALRAYRALLGDPTLVGLVLVAGLVMAGQFSYVTSSTFLFQEVYGLTAQQYGMVFGLGAVMFTLGTQAAGFLLGRVSARRIVLAGLVLALAGATAVAVVAAVVGTGPGRLVALLVVLLPTISAVGLLLPTVPTIALARHGHDAGSTSALIGAAQFGMAALGAPASGLLGASVTTMAAVMIAAFALALATMALAVRRSGRT